MQKHAGKVRKCQTLNITCEFQNFCRHIVVIFVTPARWLSKIHIILFLCENAHCVPCSRRERSPFITRVIALQQSTSIFSPHHTKLQQTGTLLLYCISNKQEKSRSKLSHGYYEFARAQQVGKKRVRQVLIKLLLQQQPQIKVFSQRQLIVSKCHHLSFHQQKERKIRFGLFVLHISKH